MSLAIPSDGRWRSGSGETQARPKATVLMTEKYALVLYLNEKSIDYRDTFSWTGLIWFFKILCVLALYSH